jgi:protein-L-isoaspartate O-methyltransferase
MTQGEPLSLAALTELAASGVIADRAFADAMIRMRWARALPAEREQLARAHVELQARAGACQAELRAAIADGSLRGAALRSVFERAPLLERDHFVEEVLGIAYPPLDEGAPEQDSMSYVASGYAEIVHAFDVMELSTADSLLDLGSGAGKVLLLAQLLCGAQVAGVERDEPLVVLAERSARGLSLQVDWRRGDARTVALPAARAIFSYLPFSGAVQREVLRRLWPRTSASPAPCWLCSGPLSADEYPWLMPVGAPYSWLQVYRLR